MKTFTNHPAANIKRSADDVTRRIKRRRVSAVRDFPFGCGPRIHQVSNSQPHNDDLWAEENLGENNDDRNGSPLIMENSDYLALEASSDQEDGSSGYQQIIDDFLKEVEAESNPNMGPVFKRRTMKDLMKKWVSEEVGCSRSEHKVKDVLLVYDDEDDDGAAANESVGSCSWGLAGSVVGVSEDEDEVTSHLIASNEQQLWIILLLLLVLQLDSMIDSSSN